MPPQKLKVPASWNSEARRFFEFLRAVGKGHTPPILLRYQYLGRGYFSLTVTGDGIAIDSMFRQLLLNKGLFYYACGITRDKEGVVNHVMVPIFQQLMEQRFQNPYSRFLRRHIKGKISFNQSIPGDFSDPFSHEYEVLYSRWSSGMLTDWDFVKDLDGMLTKFMLTKTGHAPGTLSPAFHILVDRTYKKGVGMVGELKGIFNKVHSLRTMGLHRLQTQFSKQEMSEVSGRLYNYFQYFDEFDESQNEKTDKLHGKRYRRIKYGDEEYLDETGEPYKDSNGIPLSWDDITKEPCHDCAAILGQYHCSGCDMEQCPRCGGQRLGCDCKLIKDFD